MSLPTPPAHTPPPRARWYWRVLVLKVWLAAGFLFLVLAGLGVTLFIAGLDSELPALERLFAFAGATLILLLCLHILRMAVPRTWSSRQTSV